MSKYREPWHLGPIRDGGRDIHESESPGCPSLIAEDVDQERAERIVECVNACFNMSDPEAEIPALRAEVERLQRERDTAMAAAAEIAKSTGEALVRLRGIEAAARRIISAWDGDTPVDYMFDVIFESLRSALGEKLEGDTQ